MVDAQVRVGKLEAAIATLGEDDAAVSGLKEALERARRQAHARPLHQRIQRTQDFVSRATKRVEGMREEVARAQAQLRHEEALLHDEESLLVALKEEASRAAQPNPVEPPPTVPAQFAAELTSLRECVQELRRERDDLRAELAAAGQEVNKPRKTRTLATPCLDLMITNQVQQTLVQHSAPRNSSDPMESAINRADATVKANASRLAP